MQDAGRPFGSNAASSRHRPLALLLILLGAVYLPWTWTDQLADLSGDSAIYVLVARHFAPYLPPDPIAAAFAEVSLFPPLYSAFLAATGGALDLRLAHAATTLCLLGAFGLHYAVLVAMHVHRALALAIVGIFAAMPGTLAQALVLKSESLFLLLSFGSLWFLLRAAESRRPRDFWLAAALMALALLTRSAGIALIPALLVVLVRRRPARGGLMIAVTVLPAIAWGLAHRAPQGYSDVLRAYWQMPAEALVAQLALNAEALGVGLAQNLLQTARLAWVLAPLSLIAAAVLAGRMRRGEPDAWYIAAYLALIVAWPYPTQAERFAWVAMPWLLGYAVLGGHWVAGRLAGSAASVRAAVRWMVPAVLVLVVAPALLLSLQRRFDPAVQRTPALAHLPEWYGADAAAGTRAQAHLDLAQALTELGAQVPATDCVYSIMVPTVAFYMRRDAFTPPFEHADAALFEDVLRNGRCRFFVLLAAVDTDVTRTPFYPLGRLGARLEILDARTRSDGSGAVIAMLAVARP